ncbi:MAG TPA: transglutaminase domain-containing protein [Limnobacter sp.]|uniref:transglutaminase domain-containing protein n=1 Tax=Limnobacter sp. TaxID=2003368 RepID=UPI002ED8BE9F
MLVLIMVHAPSYAGGDLSATLSASPMGRLASMSDVGNTGIQQPDRALQLVTALVRGANTDSEKAYRIYRWITQHMRHDERAAARIGDPSTKALSDLLANGRGSCAVFADVTLRMMALAGLKVRTVEGVARAGDVRRQQANHRWNEVWLNGEWRIVDTTWGAGYVDGGRFVREDTDLFFAMPQALARLSHFSLRRWESYPSGLQSATDESFHNSTTFQTFSKLSEQAVFMAAAGFPPDDLLQVAERGAAQPDWYEPTNSPVKVLRAPSSKLISPDRLARFVFESGVYEEMAVVQGRKWQRQTKQGRVFDIALNPVPGELLVMGRRKGQDEFEAVLGYQVSRR